MGKPSTISRKPLQFSSTLITAPNMKLSLIVRSCNVFHFFILPPVLQRNPIERLYHAFAQTSIFFIRQNTPNASSIKTFLHPGFPIYSNYLKLMTYLCEIRSFLLPQNLPMSDYSAKFYKTIISPILRRQSLQDYRTFYRLLP